MLASISFQSIVYYFADKFKVTGDDNLFRDFFDKGGFIWGFVIAVGIALVIAVAYYYVCHRSFGLAKLYVWIIVLLLSGAASFQTSSFYAKKNLTENLDKNDTKKRNNVQFLGSDEDKQTELKKIEAFKKKWIAEIMEPNIKIVRFALTNVFWTGIFFLVFSLLFKNYTRYGEAVPWGKPRKNRNTDKKK